MLLEETPEYKLLRQDRLGAIPGSRNIGWFVVLLETKGAAYVFITITLRTSRLRKGEWSVSAMPEGDRREDPEYIVKLRYGTDKAYHQSYDQYFQNAKWMIFWVAVFEKIQREKEILSYPLKSLMRSFSSTLE